VADKFPRAHRFTVQQRLLDAAFDLRERLEEANIRSWINYVRFGNTVGLRKAVITNTVIPPQLKRGNAIQ
jgi:hypothetical protein